MSKTLYTDAKLSEISEQYYRAAAEIYSFAQNLNKYFISGFSYGRLYSDQSAIHITNDPEFSVYFMKNKLYEVGYYANSINYHNFNYIWNFDDAPEIFVPWSEITGNSCGITLVRNRNHYCEMSHFSSEVSQHEMINFYINNIFTLEKLTQQFCEHYALLLKESESRKFVFKRANQQDMIIKKSNQILFSNKKDIMAKLSPKEKLYLKYVLRGCSIKEAACFMSRSPRTVEKHMLSLKNKLGYKTTRELISEWKYVDI